ncbi:MAG TPA: sugar phosphate isomerase/epimerase family protein [Rectinemataceae bacterium]|nr:sugar phosphate isomerase/epimerase family protein [Rectinemataceae bacterium]
MRRVGIFYAFWTHEWDVDFLPFVAKVAGLGFEQLELNGGTIALMEERERRAIANAARERGLALSYGIGLPAARDPSSLDETVRKEGVRFMRSMIDAVSSMGGGMIGGTIHSTWPAKAPRDLAEKAAIRERSLLSMRELAPYAEDSGVVLNIEVLNRFEHFLFNVADEAIQFVREVGSPALGILLDTFHMNIEEDSFGDAIRKTGPHLKALHLGETNRRPPGQGRMPWKEIRAALDDIGFDGPLVMEPFLMPGGQVGRDIAVWHELSPGADDAALDAMAAESAAFVKRTLRD